MLQISFETVTHRQEGLDITYVMRRDRRDWFYDILRDRPHANPAWYHLHRRKLTEGRLLRYADFGANIGVTSLVPARVGHQVLAVEAGPENVLLLSEAVRRNRLQGRLTVAHWAAEANTGLVAFHEASAWGSTRPSETREGETQVAMVPAAPAAEILSHYAMPDVDVIKMDIEGAELAALNGFETVMACNPSVEMIVETNWETCALHDHTPQAVWSRLHALGFETYLLAGRHLTPVTPDMPQPRFVCDVLASRRPFKELTGPLGYLHLPMDTKRLPEALEQIEVADRPPQMVADYVEAQMARL